MWGESEAHPPGILDLIWRLLADVCQAVPYELDSELVQLLKVMGRVRDLQHSGHIIIKAKDESAYLLKGAISHCTLQCSVQKVKM